MSNAYILIFLGVLGTVMLPLPEETALLAAGYAARIGRVDLVGCLVAAWLGVMGGDLITFAVGRWVLGGAIRSKVGRRIVSESLRGWGERFVKRHGWRAIVIGRFLFALRGVIFLTVGASKLRVARFAAIDGLAAAFEVPLVVGTGFAFGELRSRQGERVDLWIAILLAATLVAPPLVRAIHARRMQRRK